MINTNFVGRLGADAELRSTKNGKQYASFRVAVEDFKENAKTTTWVRVSDFTARGINMVQHLKKGSGVMVHGALRASCYKPTVGEEWQTSIEVNSYQTDFCSLGKKDEGSSETTSSVAATTPQPSVNTTIMADCGTLKRPETATVASVSTMVNTQTTEAIDDLPF